VLLTSKDTIAATILDERDDRARRGGVGLLVERSVMALIFFGCEVQSRHRN
jgi:hypothetical protein